jgi:hypothetical protein
LTRDYHIRAAKIADTIVKMLGIKADLKGLKLQEQFHDIPGNWFKGPF